MSYPIFQWEDFVIEKHKILGNGTSIVTKGKFRGENGQEVAIKYINISTALTIGVDYETVKNLLKEEADILLLAGQKFARNLPKLYGVVQGPLNHTTCEQLTCGKVNEDGFGIIFEYKGFISLAEYLHQIKLPLVLLDKLHVLNEICTAIDDLHSVGIVHGDIKPENVLISKQSPPCILVIDFGLASYSDGRGKKLFAHSTINRTLGTSGTLAYCAPGNLFAYSHYSKLKICSEMLESKEDGTVVEANRSTDMFSFGVLSWEILSYKVPTLANRINLKDLPANTPATITEMINNCCDIHRLNRLSASQCRSLLLQAIQQIIGGEFDIFFSHAWKNKPFLSHVFHILNAKGYRVWYDQNELLDHNIRNGMTEGIRKSKSVLVCLNQNYLTRENCLYELQCAYLEGKQIIVLALEANPAGWEIHRDIARILKLDDYKWFDFSSIANHPDWEDPTCNLKSLLEQLKREMTNLDYIFPSARRPSEDFIANADENSKSPLLETSCEEKKEITGPFTSPKMEKGDNPSKQTSIHKNDDNEQEIDKVTTWRLKYGIPAAIQHILDYHGYCTLKAIGQLFVENPEMIDEYIRNAKVKITPKIKEKMNYALAEAKFVYEKIL